MRPGAYDTRRPPCTDGARRAARMLVAALLLVAGLSGVAARPGMAEERMTAEVAQANTSAYPEVTVYVRVLDSGGRIVTGLEQEMFSLTEDGTPVEIIRFEAGEHTPISTVLTMDRSSSMGVEGKLQGAKEAARTFIDLMREQDRAAVVAFDDKVATLQSFSGDKSRLNAAIDSIELGECTAWYDGIFDSVGLIEKLTGRRSVILLSDGIDCRENVVQRMMRRGSNHTLDEAIEEAQAAQIPVYAIGLGAEATTEATREGYDEGKLKRVAEATGGKFYHTPSAAELKALYRELSLDMQKEYALTYRSPRPTYDGTRRNIAVTVSGSGGAGASAATDYLEQHLLNIHSSPLVFAAFLLPLLALLVVPLAPRWLNGRRAPAGGPQVEPSPADFPVASYGQPAYGQQAPVPPAPVGVPPVAAPAIALGRPGAVSSSPPAPALDAATLAPLPPAAPRLLVVRYGLEPVPLTIGRGPLNAVILTDVSAQANHAILEQRAGRYVVRDLSGGQTYVSYRGDPAQEVPVGENALRDGSTVCCCHARFTFRDPGSGPAWLEQAFPLETGMTVGVTAGSTVQLPAQGIGEVRAEIIMEGARWVVVDRASSGMLVSFSGDPALMRQLTGRNAVKAGSMIRVGEAPRAVLLEFRAA